MSPENQELDPTHPTTQDTDTTRSHKGLRIALWAVQILLALAFGAAGFMKVAQPIEALTATMAWVGDVHPMLVRFIGVAEIAGALGLILPALTRVRPRLTALAAVGLLIVMVLAAGFHVVRGEVGMVAPSIILGLLAAFVAWGRARVAPVRPRS